MQAEAADAPSVSLRDPPPPSGGSVCVSAYRSGRMMTISSGETTSRFLRYLRVEEIGLELIGPQMRDLVLQGSTLSRGRGQILLGDAQILRDPHPGAQAPVALDQVVGEVEGGGDFEDRSHQHLCPPAHFAQHDHLQTRESRADAARLHQLCAHLRSRVICQPIDTQRNGVGDWQRR